MERKIHKLLREMVKKKGLTLNEGIKIFKSKPTLDRKHGSGYWLFMAPDSMEGSTYKDEALSMSSALNLAKSQTSQFVKDNPGIGRPVHYKDSETGQFGWGYFISGILEKDPSKIEKRLDWLKSLVRKYNNKKKFEEDIKTGELTLKQVGQIQNLASAIEDAKEMNPETKAKLELYLDELTSAVENDDVFEFLTKKYSEAKEFISNNVKAGTTNYPYSVTNSFIILAAEPGAVLAAQQDFWTGRNYQIKPGAAGVSIRRPKAGSTSQTARQLMSKPGALDAYKQQQGIDPSMSFSQIMKSNPKKHSVDMAHSAIYQKAVKTSFSRDETSFFGTVYTDTMVEPIPGEEVMSIQDIIGSKEDGGGEVLKDPFHIPQKELDSDAHKQKLNILFKTLIDLADEEQINTAGITFKDGDVNEFNKLINAISYDKVLKRLPRSMGIKSSEISPEIDEMLLGYAEALSNIVKKHYGLPSDESVYNVARQGIDREEIEKMYSEIIRIAHSMVSKIDSKVNSEEKALNEVRKLVRQVLRNK
jgi:hypothetical protein